MPALIPCAEVGSHKARIAAMPVGGCTIAASRAEAMGLYKAARAQGMRVAQQQIQRGDPRLRVTLLR